jgi:hypothetical protein
MNRQFLEPKPYVIMDWQDTTTMETGFVPIFGLQSQQYLV